MENETTYLYNTRFAPTTSVYSKEPVTDTNMTSNFKTTTLSILINATNGTDLTENGTGHSSYNFNFFLNSNNSKFLNTFHECFFQQHGPVAIRAGPHSLCHYIRREKPSVR